MRKPRIFWATPVAEKAVGNAVGYNRAIHEMRLALDRAGTLVDSPLCADVAVHLNHPHWYDPIPGVPNVLYTMAEHERGQTEGQDFQAAFAHERTKLVLTPSKFCQGIFQPISPVPVEVVPLGVHRSIYTFKRRRWNPSRGPFRWLTVCAPNPRKFTILFGANMENRSGLWEQFLAPSAAMGRLRLYCKTTGAQAANSAFRAAQDGATMPEIAPGVFFGKPGLIVDNRRLTEAEIVELYHSAHGFLFLSAGEGWGFPLCEAMATGLPCVYTDYSSVQEFANRQNGYPVEPSIGWISLDDEFGVESNHRVWGALPRPESAIRAIDSVMSDYHRASMIGRQASEDMKAFSWDEAGRKLLLTLDRYL